MNDRLFGGASPRTIPSTRTPADGTGPGAVAEPGDDAGSGLHANAVSISAALQNHTPLWRSLVVLELPLDTCDLGSTERATIIECSTAFALLFTVRVHYEVKLTAVVLAPLTTTPTRSPSAG